MTLRDKMLAVIADTNDSVAEREELVEMIAIALLTRKNLFVLGEPGQAKSYAINLFRRHITGARQFERLLSKQSDEEQLFGRVDLASLLPGSVPPTVLEQDATYQNQRFNLRVLVEGIGSMKDEPATWEKLKSGTEKLELYRAALSALHKSEPTVQTAGKIPEADISQTLDHVAEIVEGKLQEVATRTLEKLREMSPDIANTLSPVIPPASSLKWADVFKSVTISGDESIPINKRGSGSKRLILLNFFRAEVERRKDEANAPGIIYAIEEPETSQHSENQKKLINALIALSTESNVQVIVTTHSAVLVNALDFKNIRLICADGSQKRVEAVRSGQLPFPSLNEVNYLAFSEISEGYHDELYGYLEEQGWLNEYKQGKTTVPYKKISANGTTREQQICMTEYIRHQIHHPENTYNARFNDSQLRRSIEDMRAFVTSKAQTPETT